MIEIRSLTKEFSGGVRALSDVNLRIHKGEFVVIVGLSGAGKSTLLRSINRLIEPTQGSVLIDGKDITKAEGDELRKMRSKIGIIFQSFNLVKRSSVLRNVLSGRLAHLSTWQGLLGLFPQEDVEYALKCLERVNIREKAFARADRLSGGQQQRVSIARALCQKPSIILADEPVASLDPPTSHMVMRDLQRINKELGITTIVNLHFLDLAREYGQRIIGLRSGQVVYDGPVSEVNEEIFEQIYGRAIREDDLRSGRKG